MRLILIFMSFLFFFCQAADNKAVNIQEEDNIFPAAYRFEEYLPFLLDKKVALTVNQTSMIGNTHLVDTLISRGVNVVKVFAPEHGFRGTADAGEIVKNSIDQKTGLPIVSLYGSNKKPTAEQLQDVDVIVFDIQDVGVRYYTYISTMHYLMEAAAENMKEIIVMDRPNPHGSYVDGPVLNLEYQSFVGMHPIPLVHGLTVGELALMINNEGWLKDGLQSELKVIEMENYEHDDHYSLPVKPSPNLPNDLAVALYPSLGLFEGTVISVGRGTDAPFQQIGHPELGSFDHIFVPESVEGAKNPPYKGQEVYGINMQEKQPEYTFTLEYLLKMYEAFPEKDKFFFESNFFEKLEGSGKLREQIKAGMKEEEIRETWKEGLEEYKLMRKEYLLYPEKNKI
ncbi:MAG: exo-beta-N-acetylmuramidase NamZ family protein [Candidatus Cyclobacteriaceae bacterium M2_1C_046]